MSKIGNFNLEMTEKVNELGYDTVEEAIADGWDSNEFYASYHEEKRNELDEAHKAWLKEKEEVIKGLEDLLQLWNSKYTNSEVAYALSKSQEKIGKAIKFIKEAEM